MTFPLKKYLDNVIRVLFISIFLLTPFTFFIYAQTSDSISISVTPAQPSAYQEVTVTIESTSIDLNTSAISWILNSKTSTQGRGIKNFRFTTGALGSVSRIQIVINTATKQKIEKNFNVRPAAVDVIWEALTYTPPLYKGKALPTSKSKIKISAIPHFILENGKRVSPKDLIYTWQQDRRVLGSLSGAGKESIIIDAPLLFEKTRVSVLVSSANETLSAQGGATITAREPEIVFYEKYPTEGIKYRGALPPDFNLVQEEITVRAEPYFFSTEDIIARRVGFKWSLNGNNVPPSTRINEIVLRRENNSGVAQLALQVENVSKILQNAIANLLIRF